MDGPTTACVCAQVGDLCFHTYPADAGVDRRAGWDLLPLLPHHAAHRPDRLRQAPLLCVYMQQASRCEAICE